MSLNDIKLELDPKSPEFISWISKDIMILIFFIIFLITYCYGKSEYYRHDHTTFQRLRAICICICIADFFWPFQYYFNFQLLTRILLLTLSSMVDILTGIAIGILSYRIFNAYYHTKQFASPKVSNAQNVNIPWYINIIMMIYLIGYLIAAGIEIFAFSYNNTDINEKENINLASIYLITLCIWFTINSIYTLLLISILIQITSLFKSMNASNDDTSDLLHHDARTCTIEEAQHLYLKMILLCLGFILYYLNLLGAYLYLFIVWDFDITNTTIWIIDHELIGHAILYATFYAYLRVRNDNDLNINYNHDGATNDLVNDDNTERINDQRKQNDNNILNKSYQNLYSDLGKLCSHSYDNSKTKSIHKEPRRGGLAAKLKRDATVTSDSVNISIESSFSNTASENTHE